MSKNLLLLFFLTLVFFYNNLFAQTIFYSVKDVWKYADAHNINILLAKQDNLKAHYNTKISYSSLLPQISGQASITDNSQLQTTLVPATLIGKKDGFVPLQFGTKYVNSAGLSGQMDLINLQTWMNVKIAKESEELSLDSLASMRKVIYQQLANQYYSYLLMQEAARLAQQTSQISDSVFNSINFKFKEGTVNEAAVDLAKINSERSQQNAITAEYQMATAKNNLKKLLNFSIQDSLIIKDIFINNIEIISHNEPFTQDDSLKVAEQQYKLGIYQYKLTNLNFLPTLNISYNKNTQQNNNILSFFSNNEPSWYPASFWTLKATWVLFNGGGRYFNSKKSSINVEEKKMIFENMQKQVALNDENLRLAYKKSISLFNSSKEVMNLSMDNYRHVTYRFQNGLATIEDRLNAFSDYINYQNQYLNNLSDLLVQTYLIKIRQQSFR